MIFWANSPQIVSGTLNFGELRNDLGNTLRSQLHCLPYLPMKWHVTFWKLLETEMGDLSSSGPNPVDQEKDWKHQGQRGEESGKVIGVGA